MIDYKARQEDNFKNKVTFVAKGAEHGNTDKNEGN